MRERAIESYLSKKVADIGGMSLKFTSAVAGVPDRIVIWRGQVWFVEVKCPEGHLSGLQQHTIAKMDAHGAKVSVVRSIQDADAFLSMLQNP